MMTIVNIKKRLKAFTLEAKLSFGSEIAVLTGANGSGKTTLLRLVAGLETPDSGVISISDTVFFDDKTNLKPEERRTGFVAQDSSLFPWLTVEENIRFGLKKEVDDGAWFKKLIIESELGHLLGRKPSSLSGGESQRVSLARALYPKPRILLLDEPFAAIDKELRPRMRQFLSTIQKEWQIPVLIVTHDHAETHVLGDRVFEMSEGQIISRKERGKLSSVPFISH